MLEKVKKTVTPEEEKMATASTSGNGEFPTRKKMRGLMIDQLGSAPGRRRLIRTLLDQVIARFDHHPRDAARQFVSIQLTAMQGDDDRIFLDGDYICLKEVNLRESSSTRRVATAATATPVSRGDA